jgi:hypothetical protein
MAQAISRRHSIFFALGAALLAAAFRWRRAEAKPTFAENTPPGDRYRTLPVGDRPVYVREDIVASGWYRDFRFHRKGGDGR